MIDLSERPMLNLTDAPQKQKKRKQRLENMISMRRVPFHLPTTVAALASAAHCEIESACPPLTTRQQCHNAASDIHSCQCPKKAEKSPRLRSRIRGSKGPYSNQSDGF